MIYKVEIRGRGILPEEFATKQEAENYAYLMTVWSGGAYRIHRMKRAVA